MRVQKSEFEKRLIALLQEQNLMKNQNVLIRKKIEKDTASPDEAMLLIKNENRLRELEKIPKFLNAQQEDVLFSIAMGEYKEKRRIVFKLSLKYYMCRTLIYTDYNTAVKLLSKILDI